MTEGDRNTEAVQRERMDAAARLAGGVAHDLNNLLTAILLNADVLAGQLERDARLHPFAATILDAAESAAHLTSQLLAFSGRQMLDIREVDLNALIAGMEGELRRTLGEGITLTLALPATVRVSRTDAERFGTVLLSLLQNAREAMPQGGAAVIETSNATPSEEAARERAAAPGEYVCVTIRDGGRGMTADIAARAAEPFFTTKERGQGPGLGLSVAHGFAKACGGRLAIETRPGGGTSVRLFLPRAE